jgi:hypothetical protein
MEHAANNSMADTEWHYELNGARLGPVSESEILSLITDQKLARRSFVWKKGMPDWTRLDATVFSSYFSDSPPPLAGEAVDNTLVWWLAFELTRLFRTHLKVDNVNGGVKWLLARSR